MKEFYYTKLSKINEIIEDMFKEHNEKIESLEKKIEDIKIAIVSHSESYQIEMDAILMDAIEEILER